MRYHPSAPDPVQSSPANKLNIRELFADERCSRTILDFLATTDVGRRIPDTAEDVQSEVRRELREREEKRRRGGRRRRRGSKGRTIHVRGRPWRRGNNEGNLQLVSSADDMKGGVGIKIGCSSPPAPGAARISLSAGLMCR
jgi:hypothetical protein